MSSILQKMLDLWHQILCEIKQKFCFFLIYLVFLWLSSTVSRLTNIFLYSANFFSSGTEKNILQSKKYLCSLWYHPHPLFKKTVKSKKYIQKYFFSYTRRILLQGKKVKWLKLILSSSLLESTCSMIRHINVVNGFWQKHIYIVIIQIKSLQE